MDRPAVPVDGPEPVGELPSPVSVGTMTLFFADGPGGGNPASAVTGAAARGGGALPAAPAQAVERRASIAGPNQRPARQSEDLICAI